MKVKICLSILVMLSLENSYVSIGQTESLEEKNNRAEEISFNLVTTKILRSKRENVIDYRTYETSDGKAVEFSTEIYKSFSEADKSYMELKTDWGKCSKNENVISPKDKIVGKRTICKTEGDKNYLILFSYNNLLTKIAGNSLNHIKLFESRTCSRSKSILGTTCKY